MLLRSLALLVLVGCGSSTAPPAPAPVQTAGEAPPVEPVPAVDAPPLAALDACVPASVRALDATIEVTARADETGGELVLMEFLLDGADPVDAAVSFHPVLLRVRGDACESLLPENTDGFDLRAYAEPEALRELLRESAAWHAERAGGIAAYAELLARGYGGTLAECAERSSEGGFCVDPDRSEALRAIGVTVVRPDR